MSSGRLSGPKVSANVLAANAARAAASGESPRRTRMLAVFIATRAHIYVGSVQLHKTVGSRELGEAVLSIQAVGVFGDQDPAPEILQIGVRDDALHQPLRQAPTTVFGDNKNVSQISNGGTVRDDSGKTNLLAPMKYSEGQRIPYRFLQRRTRNASRPIRMKRQKFMDRIEIQAFRIVRNLELTTLPATHDDP